MYRSEYPSSFVSIFKPLQLISIIIKFYSFGNQDKVSHKRRIMFPLVSPLCSTLNIKELHGRNKRDIWNLLSDCNGIWTHNHLVCKRTHNQLDKLAWQLSYAGRVYLHGAFHCVFLSYKMRVLEWIYTL